MVALYVATVLAGPYGEIYCLANDYEQAASRVFAACSKIVEASPALRGAATVTANKITFNSTGTFIQACASDYAGFAGGNPTLTICDELWGFVHEASRRLFAEAIPSPARKVSGRLTVTYAGFEGESTLLEGLYKRGMQGDVVGTDLRAGNGCLMYWTHEIRAPWQSSEWVEAQRASLPTNQFLRMIENRWVSTESSFIDAEWWQACKDPNLRPLIVAPHLPIWVGIDASVKRDSTAVVAVTADSSTKRAKLVYHKIFQPSAAAPLDFEATVERTVLELKHRFNLRLVRYDPYQMESSAQRLKARGVNIEPFPQTSSNLTEASTTLFNLIKDRNITVYDDADINLAISRAVALEIPNRGWKITKEKARHKIDVIVALGIACYAAMNDQQVDVVRLAAALCGQLKPEASVEIDVWKTPEGIACLREQERKCHICGLPVGPSSRPLGGDMIAHAGPCPKVEVPKQTDSFGDDVQPGAPGLVDILKAGMAVPRERAA